MTQPLPKPVLAVMNDLFFQAKILDAARKEGMSVETVTDSEKLMERARQEPAFILIDLNFAIVDPIGAIVRLRADPASADIPIVAFGPHVQVEMKRRALEAGCNEVIARSVFAERLPELLRRYGGGVREGA